MSTSYGLPAPSQEPDPPSGPIFPPGHPFAFEQETPQAARLTVILQCYHQNPGDDAVVSEGRWSRKLSGKEQPYGPRHLTIGEGWQALDLGWIEECSMLFIENREGIWTQVQPSQQQRDEAEKKVVELCHKSEVNGSLSNPWLIRPRASFMGEPAFLSMMVRCRHGKAKITVTAYPA